MTLISDGSTVITWKRRDLLRALRKEPHLKNIFDSLIGQDVAKKLFKSQTTTNNGRSNFGGFPSPSSKQRQEKLTKDYGSLNNDGYAKSNLDVYSKNRKLNALFPFFYFG